MTFDADDRMTRPYATIERRRAGWSVLCLLALLSATLPTSAAVVVIANRTKEPIEFIAAQQDHPAGRYRVDAGDLIPVPVDGPLKLVYLAGDEKRRMVLQPNSAYFFGRVEKQPIELHGIGLGQGDGAGLATPRKIRRPVTPGVITVKLLVDEEEPARRELWEARLRKRVKTVSALLEKYCLMKLKIVAVGSWQSDNRVSDFNRSLREFEQEVTPGTARVAIGFTSQYQLPKGRFNLGGTRGPLHSHILIREWSQHISEPERAEVLLHELGHYMGAVHSPEPNSVMRPVLGDRKSRHVDFRVAFDPANTLAMYLVGEEVRTRGAGSLRQMTLGTKRRLGEIYGQMAKVLPKDPAAPRYQLMVKRSSISPVVIATKRLLNEMTRTAITSKSIVKKPRSDRVAEGMASYLVSRAATSAATLPPTISTKAFLVALGVGLGDRSILMQHSKIASLCRLFEDDARHAKRKRAIGRLAVYGRTDLLQLFTTAAAQTVLIGPQACESLATGAELARAKHSGHFDFARLAATLAGVRFASHVQKPETDLARLGKETDLRHFIPSPTMSPSPLSHANFVKKYGGLRNKRFRKQIGELRKKIDGLSGFRKSAN